ncbi:hypothetical protein FC99_GL000601 [Levilactobacillus koreensis JCM 16448]|uniref:Uncharacterized protein n=1 Tax=Levilactobacillus koreensis TaxID=637971 RepID=A0AAC8UVH3_9LACO|nr:hypothetical protein [Levilactobacillus koreensis]AKP64372.1 hypothetical protein ABN16_04750 [Levilactobacillus koreensis]KRK88507.1 hypothetical protein FC99_GL000601 [Levilactobacillus koreensis JCM 16448]
MAHNVSQDEELLGILSDVSTHRFHQGRQVNPNSMLYKTVEFANQEGYLVGAKLDANYSHSLASIDLTKATLSEAGVAKLQALTTPDETETPES